jgi:hypothetical protein
MEVASLSASESHGSGTVLGSGQLGAEERCDRVRGRTITFDNLLISSGPSIGLIIIK